MMTDKDAAVILAGYATLRARIGIMTRCLNPKSNCYERYGGLGITICHGWSTCQESFLRDMGIRPSNHHSVERIDNTKGYWCGHCVECASFVRPMNCRWAIAREQANNRSSSRFIEHDGKTMTVAQWESHSGFKKNTIYNRLKYGWSPAKAIKTPVIDVHHSVCAFTKQPIKTVTANGESHTVSDIARSLGVTPSTVYNRLARGKPLDGSAQTRNMLYEFNGMKLTLRGWARARSINYCTLWCRIKDGMTIEQALTLPIRKRTRLSK